MRTMYLSNRELAALISPLAVAGAFYFFEYADHRSDERIFSGI